MSRRPIASVRVLRMPHLHPRAVRIEVECSASTTGLTQVPAETFDLTVPQMVTAAVFEHEARCEGDCDTTQAHQRGDQQIRAETERAWNVVRAEMARRYANGRRN
jgi:hypothetical protein